MKSFFTNLGKLLLCGATVAMIGCTDLHSDIAQTDDLANANKEQIADLQSTLDQLKAKFDADYALKSELEQVKAQIADEKAALEAAIKAGDEAAIAAAKADLDAAVAQVTTEIAGIYARLEALEASTETEEIAAQLAALDAYVLAMEEAIVGRLDTIEQALSAVTVLLEDEAAARQYEDEMLAKSIEGLQENLTSVINLVNDLQSKEYVTAEELYEVYGSIETTNTALSSVLLQLQDLAAKHDQDVEEIYAKINVVEEALSALVFTVTDVQTELDAQVAALEAIEGYIQELYLADNALQENLTQLLNVTQDQLDELYDFQNELYSQITTLQQFCTQMINSYETADQELLALIMETKAELSETITFLTNLLNDQIDDLAARVQSLVFIPEYSDGKATIEWGLLIDNDSAVNFLLNNVLTAGNIDAAKDLVKSLIADVKDVILGYTGNLEDDVNAFLDGIINEPAIEAAFKDLFYNLQSMIEATVLEYYFGLEYDYWVDWGGATPEELAAQISADILAAFNINDLDLTSIVKSLLGDLKAQGIATAKDLINKLKSVSLNDIVAQLNSDEFHGLVSKIFSTVKGLEAKVLENTALLKKESVIRYKVLGQNATALAAAIAANPSVLSYDVEAVDVRAAAPGLEITKVAAKGDEIHVTVVPQNFHYRFYLTYILEDSFLYGAAESFFDKMDKTGLISYSAALVLNDGNNIRSTEYTNFVSAENPEIFTPEVINKNGEVVEHETITAVKGQVDEITLCEGMYMGYLSVPNRVILTQEQLEAKGYFGFTETKTVKTNDKGIAGPCQFNGLTGTVKSWFDYTFTTYWAVNDIVLAVNSDLVWELPESVAVWEGKLDDNVKISLAAEDIAPWFDGLAVGQILRIEYTAFEGAVCFHVYDGEITYKLLEENYKLQGQSAKQSVEITVTAALLDILKEESILIGGSNIEVTNVTLYL